MVELPRAKEAVVDDAKLFGYLLSTDHPGGASKARFFSSLGFTPANAHELRAALLSIARTGSVVDRNPTPHGTKFVIDGSLVGPQGRQAGIRTIWIQAGYEPPRLVTAYPSGAS